MWNRFEWWECEMLPDFNGYNCIAAVPATVPFQVQFRNSNHVSGDDDVYDAIPWHNWWNLKRSDELEVTHLLLSIVVNVFSAPDGIIRPNRVLPGQRFFRHKKLWRKSAGRVFLQSKIHRTLITYWHFYFSCFSHCRAMMSAQIERIWETIAYFVNSD